MIKYTTPILKIQFNEGALENTEQIAITLKKGNEFITYFDGFTIEDDVITLELSQEDTGKLGYTTQLQVNVLYKDGTRSATKIFTVNFNENLLSEVME